MPPRGPISRVTPDTLERQMESSLSRRRVIAAGFALPVVAFGAHAINATPVSAAIKPIGTQIVVATDRLNLRRNPGTTSTVIKVLVEGTEGEVIGLPASGTGD